MLLAISGKAALSATAAPVEGPTFTAAGGVLLAGETHLSRLTHHFRIITFTSTATTTAVSAVAIATATAATAATTIVMTVALTAIVVALME